MKKVTHPGIPSLKPNGRRLQKNIKSGLTTIYTKIKSPDLVKEATNKIAIRAFTLVELIVVIIILAILGTIAFIAMQGYSADARDSSRISDINHIKTSLELQSLAVGKYPMPDNPQDVTYSGGIVVWHQGTVGENVTKILSRNLNEKPTDPLYNTEYIYSVTPTQNQFEVLSIYEGDIVYNTNQPHPSPLLRGEGIEGGGVIETVNASSNTVRVDGTYNGVYVKNGNYIIPTPSIITSLNPTGLELDSTTIKSQVIDRGTNLPNIGTPKITQSTGALTFSIFEVYNGELNEESSTGAFLSAYQAIANTYNGSSLANEGVIKTLLTQTTDEQKIEFTKSLILSTPIGIIQDDGGTTTYNCDETTKPTDNGHITYTTGSPTSVNQTYIQDATNCGFTCIDGYAGTNCEIVPITGWRSLDPNCQINDILVGTQTWAGCNSTLGTGIERGKKDNGTNGTIGSCYNYDGTNSNANCPIGGAGMASNESAIIFFTAMQSDLINLNGDYEFDTIWGKFYTWDSLDTDNDNDIDSNDTNKVCGTGYHVPTDVEWTILENYLAGTTCRTTYWRQCDGLSWRSNSSYNPDRKLAENLKIPLAGFRNSDGINFEHRGYYAHLWSSTSISSHAYYRSLFRNNSSVYREDYSQLGGLSVRCLKD